MPQRIVSLCPGANRTITCAHGGLPMRPLGPVAGRRIVARLPTRVPAKVATAGMGVHRVSLQRVGTKNPASVRADSPSQPASSNEAGSSIAPAHLSGRCVQPLRQVQCQPVRQVPQIARNIHDTSSLWLPKVVWEVQGDALIVTIWIHVAHKIGTREAISL